MPPVGSCWERWPWEALVLIATELFVPHATSAPISAHSKLPLPIQEGGPTNA